MGIKRCHHDEAVNIGAALFAVCVNADCYALEGKEVADGNDKI